MSAPLPVKAVIDRPYFVPEGDGDDTWILITPPSWPLPKAVQKRFILVDRITDKTIGNKSGYQNAFVYIIPARHADKVIEDLIQNGYRNDRSEDSIVPNNLSIDEVMTLTESKLDPHRIVPEIARYKDMREQHDPTDPDNRYQQQLTLAQRRLRPDINEQLSALTEEQIRLLAERRSAKLLAFGLDHQSSSSALELALRGVYDSVAAINEDVRNVDENDRIINTFTQEQLREIKRTIDPKVDVWDIMTDLREFVRYNYHKLAKKEQERWGLISTLPISKAKRAQGAKIAAEREEQRRWIEQADLEWKHRLQENERIEAYMPDLLALLPDPGVSFPGQAYWIGSKTGHKRTNPVKVRLQPPTAQVPRGQLAAPKDNVSGARIDVYDDRKEQDRVEARYIPYMDRITASLVYRSWISETYGKEWGYWSVDLAPYVFARFREKLQPQLPDLRTDLTQVLGKDLAGYTLAFL